MLTQGAGGAGGAGGAAETRDAPVRRAHNEVVERLFNGAFCGSLKDLPEDSEVGDKITFLAGVLCTRERVYNIGLGKTCLLKAELQYSSSFFGLCHLSRFEEMQACSSTTLDAIGHNIVSHLFGLK
jgi:hypothetical protein